MKRVLILGVAIIAFGAFLVAPGTMAGKNCGSAKTADATQASSKACGSAKTADAKLVSSKACGSAKTADAKLVSSKACGSAKTADAKLVSSKACGSAKTGDAKLASAHAGCNFGSKECTDEEMAACAAKLGVSVDELKKMCATGDMSHVNMSIQGMTCGGCEGAVTACLEDISGVVKVHSVSHKEGTASLCISKEVDQAALISAVANKGFQAEVIPAVATVSGDADVKTVGSAGCGKKGADKAACSKPCGSAKSADVKSDASASGGTK